ncbi:choline dehydrogenase-like protein [Lophiotrema nucula]|uniref:Choline dehydrogenase-like protein n=1 Tax=Lophiotrema nucula TaxID=690887 RepID=A0A6A5YKH8_9PLEO|nr:choline dehydrogenase-like protein [Lophiotrema nucula]
MLRESLLLSALLVGAQSRALGRFARAVDEASLLQNGTYDFVIAGGGIAGLTVADRLSEDPDVSVLVIEYGPFDQREDGVMIPGAYFPVPYLWLPLLSTPQTALNGTVYSVPCGRVVGGGSVVNAMFFHRSSALEYDSWEALGATGFDFHSLLPYFKKSETFNEPDEEYAETHNITWDSSVHGFSGPVQTSFAPYDYPGSANFYNGAHSIGIESVIDTDAGDATGLFRLKRSVDPNTQTRSSARVNHYDRVIASRPNYHVLPSTAVAKVLFNGTAAVGVEYVNQTTRVGGTIKAKKEVIIAAGSVHSPQILQLSGVGPAPLLESLGITPIVDLPGVGSNLQDHLVLTVNYNYTNNLFPNGGSLQDNTTYATEQRALYDAGEPSAFDLTATTGNLIMGLPLKNYTNDYASVISLAQSQDPAQLLGGNPDPTVLSGYKKQRKIIIDNINEIPVGDISWNTGPATSIYMVRPLSRGSIKANSTDILVDPLIDFGAITDPTDLETLLAIYLKNRELMATPDIAILGPIETSPAPGVTDKEQVKARLKATLQPSNAHQCCTNPMLKKEDGGVVDPEHRVYGTTGLSVVDASVWPFVVGNGPQASVYATGEKAADVMKERYGLA